MNFFKKTYGMKPRNPCPYYIRRKKIKSVSFFELKVKFFLTPIRVRGFIAFFFGRFADHQKQPIMKQAVLKLLLLFIYCSAFSQIFSPKNYPKHYFRDPLNIPISLAGNFGELRPNHYHMGLDIRTEKRENLPVYAAADGYIARIKIEPAGFGQAIYIVHPNGYTTLYAHLNSFYPQLATYIKQQQYNRQTWRLQVDLPPNLFTVKKGELIAFSGSTGGSQAPHLHFEIRRSSDDVNLNPMLFGFAIPDNTRLGHSPTHL